MTERHRLHAAQIDGASISPGGAFTMEPRSAPPDVAVVELSGELDIAATAAVRSLVDDAAGGRALVLDLSRVTCVELLRAGAEHERHETRLVLAGIGPVVRRLLELTRTTELFTLVDDPAAAVALVAA